MNAEPKTRALDWLAEKANDYLRWHAEREVMDALLCPECETPTPWCYCEERDR